MNLPIDIPAVGRKRAEWQTYAQLLRAIRRARAERSQADRMAIEAGDDFPVRVRFERDVTAKSGGNSWRRSPSPSRYSGSAQAGDDPQVWGWIGLSSFSDSGRSRNPSFTGTS
jgi:hypothetical protein